MTSLQYSMLLYINAYSVPLNECKILNQITLHSLANHKWIERKGSHIVITREGLEAASKAEQFRRSEQAAKRDITDRVKTALTMYKWGKTA